MSSRLGSHLNHQGKSQPSPEFSSTKMGKIRLPCLASFITEKSKGDKVYATQIPHIQWYVTLVRVTLTVQEKLGHPKSLSK